MEINYRFEANKTTGNRRSYWSVFYLGKCGHHGHDDCIIVFARTSTISPFRRQI